MRRGFLAERVLGTVRQRFDALTASMLASLAQTPAEAAYRAAFEAGAGAPATRALTRAELVARLATRTMVLAGGFHTCAEVPRAFARLIEALVAGGRERWILVLPCFEVGRDDRLLAAFAAGDLSAPELVARVDESAPWPFERRPFVPLLEAARAARAPVVGMGPLPSAKEDPHSRARAHAESLLGLRRADPTVRILAVVGEQHLADPHLPAALAALGLRGERCERLVVSAHRAWFDAAAAGEVPAASLLDSDFVALHAVSPLRLAASFCAWRHAEPEIPWPLARAWAEPGEPGLETTLLALQRAIAGAFDLAVGNRHPPFRTVVGADGLERLGGLGLGEAGLDEVLGQLARGRSYFLPAVGAIVLAGADLAEAAEEVAHALHFHLAAPEPARRDPAEDFFARALAEAVGFYGSRVVVPDRSAEPGPGSEAAAGFLAAHTPSGRAGPPQPDAAALRTLFTVDPETYLAAAHLAGYALGARLPMDAGRGRLLFSRPIPRGPTAVRASWIRAWEGL